MRAGPERGGADGSARGGCRYAQARVECVERGNEGRNIGFDVEVDVEEAKYVWLRDGVALSECGGSECAHGSFT